MKKLVFAAALMLGTAAVAQDATQETTGDMSAQPDTTTEADTGMQTDMSTQTGTTMPADTSAQAGTMSTMQTMPAGPAQPVAPGNDNPERDARGIAVVSDPAMAPAGANQPVSAPPGAQVVVSSNQSAVFSTQPSTKEYPPCSKGVTDGCVQTYERGSRPR